MYLPAQRVKPSVNHALARRRDEQDEGLFMFVLGAVFLTCGLIVGILEDWRAKNQWKENEKGAQEKSSEGTLVEEAGDGRADKLDDSWSSQLALSQKELSSPR